MTAPLRAGEPIVVQVALGERAYDIVIGRGLIGALGARVKALRPARAPPSSPTRPWRRIISRPRKPRSNAAGHRLRAHRRAAPGEASKSYATFEKVCEAIIAARIERGDLVIALGGGVIGDLAGFAAACVRRGIDFVQVPTTLLAQVDSSVGGKTGINSPHGKNLIGAFHQPMLVVADTALLDTLPPREFRAGYAEVAKYGLLGDAAFFAWLEANWQDVFAGGARARARHRRLLPRQGRHRRRATSAKPASARCSISATPSATRSKPRPASPTGCCTARRWRSAWRWPSSFRRDASLFPRRMPRACVPILQRLACRPGSRTCPATCLAPTADGTHRPGQEGEARQAHLHSGARHRPGLRRRTTSIRRRCAPFSQTRSRNDDRDTTGSPSSSCCCACCCRRFSPAARRRSPPPRAPAWRGSKSTGTSAPPVVNRLLASRERLLGALLFGNNAVNIAASSLATGVLLAWFGNAGVVYATVAMTIVVVVFSEILPKTAAFNAPDRIALAVARPLNVFVKFFGPVLMAVEALVRWLLKLVGMTVGEDQQVLSAREELRGAVDLFHREGEVENARPRHVRRRP